MNRKVRIFLSAFIALSIAGLVALIFLHRNPKNVLKVALKDSKIEVKIDKFHYSGNKEGRVEWVLDADSARRTEGGDLIVLDKLKLVFYAKSGKPYTLTAKEGRFRESTEEIEVEKDVTVESYEGYRMETDSLKYSVNSRVLSTDARVVITSKGMDVSGVGLRSDVDKGRIILHKNIKAVFRRAAI